MNRRDRCTGGRGGFRTRPYRLPAGREGILRGGAGGRRGVHRAGAGGPLVEVFKAQERPVSLVEVQTVLASSPDHPIVAEPQKALQQAVREGVEQGQFAVQLGRQVFTGHVPEEVLARPDLILIPQEAVRQKAEPSASAVTVSVLKVTGSGKNLYPIRKVLEQLQGQNVAVQLTIEDRGGELTRKHEELERLLNEYAVSHEWVEGHEETPPHDLYYVPILSKVQTLARQPLTKSHSAAIIRM